MPLALDNVVFFCISLARRFQCYRTTIFDHQSVYVSQVLQHLLISRARFMALGSAGPGRLVAILEAVWDTARFLSVYRGE